MLVSLMGLPFVGPVVKWVLRLMFGIKDTPNVTLGELRASPDDGREAYRGWYHIEIGNCQRGGWSRILVTRDAEACVVKMGFTKGASASIPKDGVFLVGPTEMPKKMITLIVDRPTQIPVVIVAEKDVSIGGLGTHLRKGSYITGGDFFHDDLRCDQKLEPGSYEIALVVSWKGGELSRTYTLAVPANARPAGADD